MFKSIRWTLLLWYAAMLTMVLGGFGLFTYLGIRHARFAEMDAELVQSAQLLASATRLELGPPPDDGPGRRPGDLRDGGPHPPPDREPRGNFPSPPDGDRRDRGDEGPPSERDSRFDRGLDDFRRMNPPRIPIPRGLAEKAGDPGAGMFYYVVWHLDGDLLAKSPDAGEVPFPGSRVVGSEVQPPQIRQRGELREAYVHGGFDTTLLVGRSTRPQQAKLHELAWQLMGIGLGTLAIGLLGGMILSSRALRPIDAMTRVAQDISASNLSNRIDVAETKTELGTLAHVLNDTFARLEAAFQQQVRFTADASHELRTPLTVIHTHAQLAMSKPRTVEEYQKTIATCLRASTRMKDLVDALLLLARADAGRLTLDRRDIDLRGVVEDCVEMMGPLANEKQIRLESVLQPVVVHADPTRIGQVITNLLTNAVRYNREGGEVRVTLKAMNSWAELSISDTGLGISPEAQTHVFERFFRVDQARNRQDGGSGLGLAICKSIVEAHGGSIGFESEPGEGATFVVRLPLSAENRLGGDGCLLRR